jgi:hypothetical protein
MADRIVWTESEREKLAMGTAALLVTEIFMSYREAFDETQRRLIAPSRRRVIASLESGTPWLREMVEARVKMLQAEQRTLIMQQALLEAPLEKLMAAYVNKLAAESEARAIKQLSEVLDLRIAEAVEAALDARPEPRKEVVMVDTPVVGIRDKTAQRKRPTIVVVGPLASQMAHVKLATESVARLRFVDKDQNPQHALGTFKGADFIVGMTKFLNHGVENTIKSLALAKGKYRRFPGGMETLTTFIKSLATQPEDKEDKQAA